MATKKYVTIDPCVRLYFTGVRALDGKTIELRGGTNYPVFRPSEYTTSDKEVQEYLENSKQFGRKFKLGAAPKGAEVKTEKGGAKVKIVTGVTTLSGAIGNLVKAGADPDGLDTIDDVRKVAAELGISYPRLKG